MAGRVTPQTSAILRAADEEISNAPIRKLTDGPEVEDAIEVAVKYAVRLRGLPPEERERADVLLAQSADLRGYRFDDVLDAFEKARASAPSADEEAATLDGPSLQDVVDAVRSYLDVQPGEEAFVVGALAVAVSKALTDEEPLWLMLIGPPSSGKTEAIRLLDLLADLRVDELTRAGLLSWSTS